MFDIVCVGVIVSDTIAKTVDSQPDKGKLELIDNISLHTGGCAMNAAINLSKLGAKTALIGMIGNDGFGKFIVKELEKHNVSCEGISISDSVNTSCSIVLVSSDGERSFLHYDGANGVFSEKNICYKLIEQTDIVFVAGSLLMSAFDGLQCSEFLKKCKAMGKTTVLDTVWDNRGHWIEKMKPSLPYVDYFIPSLGEAEMLSGETDHDLIADFFFRSGVRHVVIKLASNGCYIKETINSEGRYLPAYKVEVADTTGAGDSFCSGFLFGLSKGMSITDCCRLGNAVGAHCVMQTGASAGIKSYDEIKAFMEGYNEQ